LSIQTIGNDSDGIVIWIIKRFEYPDGMDEDKNYITMQNLVEQSNQPVLRLVCGTVPPSKKIKWELLRVTRHMFKLDSI
jgi:hypothetical protein